MTRKGREYIMPFKISNAKRTAQQMAMRKAKTRQQKKPRFSATPAFKPTKADDRGYRKGGVGKFRTGYRKGGVGKFRSDLDGDMSGRTGYAGGGTLASMRKNIIGIKKDRGLTAKSGARTGMTKKRATGRGGR